jgi:hypothetical protein
MRWVRVGDVSHIVFNRQTKTACGVSIAHIASIIDCPGIRCGGCDYEWREAGAKKRRQLEAKEKIIRAAEADTYEPRFNFEDFDS